MYFQCVGTERYPHNRALWASDRRHVCRCDSPARVSLRWQHRTTGNPFPLACETQLARWCEPQQNVLQKKTEKTTKKPKMQKPNSNTFC
jgi:hypothetical protein